MKGTRLIEIICVSLKDSHRKSGFKKAFSNASKPIRFIDATDGRYCAPELPSWLSEIESHPKYSSELRREIPVLNYDLNTRELACAISHLRVWQMVSEFDHDDYVLVCEDDAVPKNTESFERDLQCLLDEMINGEFVYVGYTGGLRETRKFWILRVIWHFFKRFPIFYSLQNTFRFNRSVAVSRRRRFGKKHVMHAGQHWGAFGYLINRISANHLLRLNRDLEMTSDGTFRYARLSNTIQMSVATVGLIIVDSEYPSFIRSRTEQTENFANYEFG
jgi:GR25 family glycosyltransferase involved in LPS biosynthesis